MLGKIETERVQNEAGDYDVSWSKLTPLDRIGKPSDVAAVLLLPCGVTSLLSE